MAVISGGTTLIDNGALSGSPTIGDLTLISTQTASASATIDFTSNIDSTYDSYVFKFINIHPATDNALFTFQANASGGSGFNETMTTTAFYSYHNESGSDPDLLYNAGADLAQGTGFQRLAFDGVGNGNDESASGYLHLFNPSNTTFVKHFIARCSNYYGADYAKDCYVAGYFNITSSIDEIQFKMSSGNIDDGIIKMYGVG